MPHNRARILTLRVVSTGGVGESRRPVPGATTAAAHAPDAADLDGRKGCAVARAVEADPGGPGRSIACGRSTLSLDHRSRLGRPAALTSVTRQAGRPAVRSHRLARVVGEESFGEGEGDGLGLAVDAELGEEALHVAGDGLLADHEPACDLLGAVAVGEQAEDLELAGGELVALCRWQLGVLGAADEAAMKAVSKGGTPSAAKKAKGKAKE